MATASFLKDLPSTSESNFTQLPAEGGKHQLPRAKIIPRSQDTCNSKLIVTEKRSFLLRYLHQRWDKVSCLQQSSTKRAAVISSDEESASTSHTAAQPARKMPRTT